MEVAVIEIGLYLLAGGIAKVVHDMVENGKVAAAERAAKIRDLSPPPKPAPPPKPKTRKEILRESQEKIADFNREFDAMCGEIDRLPLRADEREFAKEHARRQLLARLREVIDGT